MLLSDCFSICIVLFYCFCLLLHLMVFRIYCLCMFFVPKKKKRVYSEVSRDLARFVVFTVKTLGLQICWCVVCCLCHIVTSHTLGAKRLNLGFFFPHVCGLSHFEDLVRLFKIF